MRTLVHHGHASTTRDGRIGSHVELHLHAETAEEWSGTYRFASHGMTSDEFVARVGDLKAYHAAKMSRLNGFRALKMRDVNVGGVKHRIIEANILERGTDVELRLGVYVISALGHQHHAFTMDHRNGLIYPNIEAVPDDDAIVAIVRKRISDLTWVTSTHEQLKAAVAGIVEA